MNRRRLLLRLLNGRTRNVAFNDLVNLVEGFGFRLARTGGSHRIYRHPTVPSQLNLQPDRGQAKPYQIQQFIDMIEEHGLTLEDE